MDLDPLAKSLGIHPQTARLLHPFFAAAGLAERVHRGVYVASDAALAWEQLRAVDPATALASLQQAFRRSWYWISVAPVLERGQATTDDVVAVLQADAGASSHHREQLLTVVRWLEFVRLIDIDEPFVSIATGEATPRGAAIESPDRCGSPIVLRLSFELELTADDLARLSADRIRTVCEAITTMTSGTSSA